MNGLVEISNILAGRWIAWIWPVVWQSAVLAGIVYVITLWRRLSPAVRFWLWMLVPLRLLVMPLITISLPLLPTARQAELPDIKPVFGEAAIAEPREVRMLPVRPAARKHEVSAPVARELEVSAPVRWEDSGGVERIWPSVWAFLMAAWLAGVAFCLARAVTVWRRMSHLAADGREVTDEEILLLAEKAAEMLGLRRIPRIVVTDQKISPIVSGILRPAVVLPTEVAENVCGEELFAVFAHEFAHLRRRDPLVGWVLAVCEAVYFFHPAFYFAKRRALFERERACDEWVVAAGKARPSTYANALVSAAEICRTFRSRVGPVGVVAESFTDLKKRLMALGSNLKPKARLSISALILLVAVGLISVPGIVLTARPATAAKPDKLEQGLVLHYSFDNDKGRKVTDSSGRGNHGKISSGTYIANGKIGRALYFNGAGDSIDIGDDSSIQSDVFTLTAWIRTNDTRKVFQPILSFADLSYVVSVMADGHVRYEVSREKVGGTGTTDVRTGQWVFVAVTRDSDGEGSIYVNGKLENSFRCDATSRFTYTGKVGGDYAHREYFSGSIDEVRIYNRALSTSQTEQLYTSTNRPDTGSATAKDIRIDRDRPLGQINVTGTARDEKGKAVSDALVTLLPGGTSAKKEFRTDAEGRFSGHYSLQFGSRDIYIDGVYVRARHQQRNLAAVVRIPKARDQELELTLTEPVTLTGRISDPDGNPIRQASITVWFGDGSWGTVFGWNNARSVRGEIAIDDKGSFEIKSVPHGCFYEMKVHAEGYGYKVLEVGTWDRRTKSIDLGTIVFAPANLSVSGVVVNENGEPVGNDDISWHGEGQPWPGGGTEIRTDAKGNFRIRNLCPGTIAIWAHVGKHGEQTGEYSGRMKQGELHAKAGEEDVRIVVKDMVVGKPETPKPLPKPLVGKKLPDFHGIKIDFDSEQTRGKSLLVCFLKMGHGSEAGESRHCLMKLVHMTEELDKKDIRVFVVYDESKDEKSLADLKSSIPFPVGIFEGEIEKVVFRWGLRGWWPRAILTDRDHTVINEGYGWQVIRGLDKKLKATQGNSAVLAPVLSPKGKDEMPNHLASNPGTRMIHFPKDRSMGLARVGELRPTDRMWTEGWEEVGQAKGDVSVPADKDVWLTINADGLDNLSFLKALGQDDVQALNFGYLDVKRIDDKALEHLAPLTGLRLVSLKHASISDAGLEHLTKLNKLESLHLQSAEISDESLKHVGRIGSLLYLDLGLTPVTDKGLAHLQNLSSLRTISLGQTSITGTGFSHLAGLESLTYAHLCDSGLTDEGLGEVAKLKSLEILRLDGVKVTDRGIGHLEDLTRLRELNLVDTDITDAGLDHIVKVTSLESLELAKGTTTAGLGKLTSLTKLRHLGIWQMQYTGDGLGPLRQFRNLQYLALMRGITDEDLAAIGTLTSLEELIINDSPITNDGLAHLATLKSLKKVTMNGTATKINMDATVSGLAALKETPLTELVLHDIKLDESRYADIAAFPALEFLYLGSMPIIDEDLAVVGKLSQLKRLLFNTDTVSDGGLEYLAGLNRLENFQPLAPLTDKGLYHIGKMKMKGLRRLIVRGHFTDEGLRHLEDLNSLQQLTLTTSAEISTESQERLKRKLPNLFNYNVRRSREVRQPPKVGEAAPSFALKPLDDDSSEEISVEGKAVLLYFWATWCIPCKASTPGLKQLYAKLKKRHGDRFVMLGLSIDSDETLVRRYVEKEAIPWPQICIGRNSQTAADYGVTGVPMYYVIGPDVRIIFSDHNAGDTVEAAIDRVLAE